jgi:hypothetical protein
LIILKPSLKGMNVRAILLGRLCQKSPAAHVESRRISTSLIGFATYNNLLKLYYCFNVSRPLQTRHPEWESSE